MPRHYRRRPARRPRRPVRRPRRRMGTALTNVDRALAPFAQRYITKMKWGATIVTDALGSYTLRLNSVFDPDLTSVGTHRPYGFNELATIYNRYRVISCGWRINQASGSTGTPIIISSVPSNDASLLFSNLGAMIENPRSKYVTQALGGGAMVLHSKSYIPKLVGQTRPQYMAESRYSGDVLSNPLENALLFIQTFNGFSGAQIAGIGLQVVLEYTVEWYDVKHLVQSL